MRLSKFFIAAACLALPAFAIEVTTQAHEDSIRDLPAPSADEGKVEQQREFVRVRGLALHRLSSHGSSSSKKISVSSKSVPPPVSSKSALKPVRPPVSSKSFPPPVPSPTKPSTRHPTPGKGGKGMWAPTGKGGNGHWPPTGKGQWPPTGKGQWPPTGKGKGYYPPPPPGKGKGSYPPPGKGKGKGYVPPPGKGKGKGFFPPMEPVCNSFGVIFRTDDLVPRKTPTGRTFDNVPFYDGDGQGGIIGFYSENRVNLPSEDCVGTGTFSFGRNYTSQIFVQFTCNGASTSVVGGTGDYGCAEGYLEYGLQTNVQVNALITICSTLCPVGEAPPKVPSMPPPSMPAPSMPAPHTAPLPVSKPTAKPVKGTKAPHTPNHPKE